jgi:enoyl-CoA hydratase/carnithine racemase
MSLVALESSGEIIVARLHNGVTNTLSPDLVEELAAVVGTVRKDHGALLLAGGEKFFSIGLDLPCLVRLSRAEVGGFFELLDRVVIDLLTLPVPTACAARGHSIGGGLILMLPCDHRVAADEKASVGLPEIQLGLPVPYVADMLIRLVAGDGAASDMIFTGEAVGSVMAKESGVVSQVFPKDEVEEKAREWLSRASKLSPRAFSVGKTQRAEVVLDRYGRNRRAMLERFLDCWFSQATQELLRARADKL